jgi:hypothetical protein
VSAWRCERRKLIYGCTLHEANTPSSHPNHLETTITIQDGISNQDPDGQDLFSSLLSPRRRRRPRGISSSSCDCKISHLRCTFYNKFADCVHDREVLRTSVTKGQTKEVLFARPLSVLLLLLCNKSTKYRMSVSCISTETNSVLIDFSCRYFKCYE